MDNNKFTYQALQILDLAQLQARSLRREFTGTEELLLALALPEVSSASIILADFSVKHDELIRTILLKTMSAKDMLKRNPDEWSAKENEYVFVDKSTIPFSRGSQFSLDKAIDLAGSGKAGLQHILYGILSFDSSAVKLLRSIGIDLKGLDAALFEMLNLKDANLFDSMFSTSSPDTGAPGLPPRPHGSLKDKYGEPIIKEVFAPSTSSKQPAATLTREKSVSGWFAPQAQIAMAKAFDQSVFLGHYRLGTEHILFGLVSGGTKCTTSTFQYTKVNAASVNDQIKLLVPVHEVPVKEMEMHKSAITLLEQSRSVMSQCSQELIECEHLLIAIIQSSDSLALTILQNLGVDPRVLKEVLLFWMNKYGPIQGSRSIIGRIDYARVKELNADDKPSERS
jgi:ATP-dependent Clp protease ATP-binding subunit ClpA